MQRPMTLPDPNLLLDPTTRQKHLRLEERLSAAGRLLVAFSGGVDSTYLLAVAQEVLGGGAASAKPPAVLAVTVVTPAHPAAERQRATELAARLGVAHRTVDASDLTRDAFTRNAPDRCYHCKRALFGLLGELAAAEGRQVVEGSNQDDVDHDYRPGLRALRELGVGSPLLEVGLTKSEIRLLSRALGLPTADLPAAACLASRIPYGEPITEEKLRRVDRAEQAVRDLGIRQVRVREHGAVARLEVAPADFPILLQPETRGTLTAAVRQAGYQYVALDLEGYRTGALNEVLSGEKYPSKGD